ncbi:MAG: hypothetical protein UU21_C0021G0014 [Candidatus Levybacteria bacterium GW2011_GWA2_40_8]|nr:MAG: hypothetical protein UU21_C0021G0014 [Candidatus Levybacteria bacterium GW2011_GWA2_40_8]
MRKSLLTFFAYSLFLFLSVSTISVAFSFEEQKNISLKPTISNTQDLSTMETLNEDNLETEKKVEYALPYPGILPDHPLYFLKNIRDKIMDFLIRDPLKRVEFNLLMSDKRMNMALSLSEKGKDELAEKIASEAEMFYEKAVLEVKKAQEQQRELNSEILDKLEQASLKYQEVISKIITNIPEDKKEGYKKVLEAIAAARKQLEELGK